jgi:membrane protease YdiL (CAAX protease family)
MPLRQQQQATPGPAPRVEPDPDNPPWGVLEAVGLLLTSFLLMLLTTALLLIPYVIYRGVRLDAFAEFVVKDPGAIVVQIVSIIPAHLLTLALAWLIVTRAGKYPFFKTLGWEWGAGFTLWRSAGLAVALLMVGLGIVWLTGPTDNALERLIQSSRAAALATAFAASLTAPIVEEIVFRGVLYSALRRLIGVGGAVAVVLLIFAVIHVPQYWPSYGVIFTILLLSVVLTLIRARTGQLLPCFVIHFVFNTIQAVLIVLNPYLERLAPEAPTPAPVPAPGLLLELFARLFSG